MAFLKPVECHASIYYGVYVCSDEIYRAKVSRRFDGTDEQFVKHYGLEYISVGDEKRAQEYIIGKKLDTYRNFLAIKLKHDNEEKMFLEHLDGTQPTTKLTTDEENALKMKLLKMGIMGFCEYYLLHHYKANFAQK